jgi:hypothetical protein
MNSFIANGFRGLLMSSENRKQKPEDIISGDRRQDRRYGLHLDLKWKLIRRRRVLDNGTGSTIDLSSGGLLFDAGRHLPEGLNVEVAIAWPVLLHNIAPLHLIVTGKIVRSRGRHIAVRATQHEFRTAGIPQENRGAPPRPFRAQNSPPILAGPAVFATLGKLP